MLKQPQLVGIVNATPDSFSDGGAYDPVAHALRLIEQGAQVIDVGAESTRPNAEPVSPQQEWERLQPVLEALRGKCKLSVDTRHAETAKRALEYDVAWINDVTGLQSNEMIEALKDAACDVVVMHSLTVPVDPIIKLPDDEDVIVHMLDWTEDTLTRLQQAGISSERVILDPGIGFGTTPAQSIELICHMRYLLELHPHWLLGHSRKSFMGMLSEKPAAERDEMTRAFSLMLAEQGVKYLRVHDVEGHKALWTS